MIIGYTQGTYDLFHIGHLNLLKNAKENCDYLIVGINSDKLVENYKGKKVMIPQQERMQIVEALKVVDKVILCDSLDKMDIWKKCHFNKIFIGTDWKGSERWHQTELQLKAVNAEVIYLPHTDGISTSILQERLMH